MNEEREKRKVEREERKEGIERGMYMKVQLE